MFSCESYKVFKNILCVLYLLLQFWLKKLSEWFYSISETIAANSVSKSFDCRNRYQYIVM